MRNYFLDDVNFQQEVGRHITDDLKSLTEEIALARTLLERRLNGIKDDAELIASTAQITNMLLTIEKLVSSCHRIEQSLGVLIGREKVVELAKAVAEILLEELQDVPGYEAIIDRISTKLMSALAEKAK